MHHGVVAVDQVAGIFGDGGQHRGDHFPVRRQRDVFLGAGMDRGDRCARIGGDAAGNDRHMDVFGFEPDHQIADVDADLDQQKVRAAP